MTYLSRHSIEATSAAGVVWRLAARQHGLVAHRQLISIGLSASAIKHRLASGRLHGIRRGVYVVGRPQVSREGHWMAAVLACGPGAVLSHESAAACWQIRNSEDDLIDVAVFDLSHRQPPGVRIHRRGLDRQHLTIHRDVPLTTVVCTLVDLAASVGPLGLGAAVNEADKRDLVTPEGLRAGLEKLRGRRGVRRLRSLLDRQSFKLSDSDLERRFLRLVGGIGLPLPQTRQYVNGFRVDFYWPELGLVVETDGLRYHRTPAEQARDRLRDQAHTATGLTPLRFTHAQIRFEAARVEATLRTVIARLTQRVAS